MSNFILIECVTLI